MSEKATEKGLAGQSVRTWATLHTFSLMGIVLSMGYAGAVQENGAAYVLCFLTFVLAAMTWLRGRENLRALEVRLLPLPELQAGKKARLVVELTCSRTEGVSGVEVKVLGGGDAWCYVEQVSAGEPLRLRVPVSFTEAGWQKGCRLILRSAYPLGFFSATRTLELAEPMLTYPKAGGQLPLPSPQPSKISEGASSSAHPQSALDSREGDDFSGLREWQRGDSLKQVHWRALARGRPLLVKQWSGSTASERLLDWYALPVVMGDEEKRAQLARWIEQAAASSLPYALRLPGREIPAALGPAHQKMCLSALAEVQGPATALVSAEKRVPPGHERGSYLPRVPLLVLCFALFTVASLLMEVVPYWTLGLFTICALWRLTQGEALFQRMSPARTPGSASIPIREVQTPKNIVFAGLGVLLLGALTLHLTQYDLFSMEGGMSVLILLMGGKLLESRSPHDFQVLALIGWFLCLCSVLIDQSLSRSLWMLLWFILITVCMARFRRGRSGWWPSFRLTGRMLLQALPLTAFLFFVFPRGSLSFLGRIGTHRTSQTGVTDSLEPGKISSIAKSDEVAFRAEFPQQAPPDPNQRYWRCIVLWQCDDGLIWQKGSELQTGPKGIVRQRGDLHQIITLEPHGQRWLPALDLPIQANSEGRNLLPEEPDETLIAFDPVDSLMRYQVHSRPYQNLRTSSAEVLQKGRKLPRNLSAKTAALAEDFRQRGKTPANIAQEALLYFRDQKFKYSLEPGAYEGGGALDEFLFQRRVGFCEHFSAAFTTLMRAAGVPARIVIGYMGGEWSQRGNYMIVRQADAHAWSEIYLEQQGWTRVDPTAVLVPDRVNLDLRTLLAGGEEELVRQRDSFLWRSLNEARLWWDGLEYDWYSNFISFDEESQIAWLSRLGLGQLRGHWLLISSLTGLLLGLGLLYIWLQRRAPVRDPWLRAWLHLCQQAEKRGAPARRSQEGPLDYGKRLQITSPQLGASFSRLAAIYALNRYGPERSSEELKVLQKGLT